jgi:hypothetical protein
VPVAKLIGHKEKIYSAKIRKDGKMIASVGEDAELLIWDMAKLGTPCGRMELKAAVGYDILWP